MSNLKSVALTVLELLAFNARNFSGHVTQATPLLEKVLRGHVRTVPGNMHVKFEVRSFNRFGAIIARSAAHRHTRRHTSNENSIFAIHSVHLVEILRRRRKSEPFQGRSWFGFLRWRLPVSYCRRGC